MNRGIALSPGAVLVLSLIYFFGGISSLGAVLLSAATSLVMRQQSNCVEAK